MARLRGKGIKQDEIIHQNLSGHGTYAHSEIDAHINDQVSHYGPFVPDSFTSDFIVPENRQLIMKGMLPVTDAMLFVYGKVFII